MSINLSALMKQRYDTAANWTAQNPTLLAGEIGIESDTKKWKVGTGSNAWTSLTYAIGGTYPIVNADVAAGAAIAYSKLATLTSGNIVLGSAANVATSTAVTGDVTISNTGVTAIAAGVIVNADINASAAIVDTKLATIATAGKVSNSATTAASANTASAIVARDASGNFTAGTITAALTGSASANVLKAGDTMSGVLAVTAGTAALPGIAVSGDLNTGIYSPGADQLAISTSGTGQVFVDANGNVGIGAAPNTWHTNAKALQIGALGSAIFQQAFVSPSTYLTANYYLDANSRGRYISAGFAAASIYRQVGGLHTWYTAPIGRSIPVTAVTSGQQYFVTTLGTTTLAEWQVLFSALTVLPTVDQVITATASGTLPGSPAATVTQTISITEVMNIGAFGTTTVTAAASQPPFIAKISTTEAARIDSSGRLLVGTSSASGTAALQVPGSLRAGNSGDGGNDGNNVTQVAATPPSGALMAEIFCVGNYYSGTANTHTGFYSACWSSFTNTITVIKDVNHSAGANQGFEAVWSGTQVVVRNKNLMSTNQGGRAFIRWLA